MRFPTKEEDMMMKAIEPYLDNHCKFKDIAPDVLKDLAVKLRESLADAVCY